VEGLESNNEYRSYEDSSEAMLYCKDLLTEFFNSFAVLFYGKEVALRHFFVSFAWSSYNVGRHH
jgi:hypothetical protein